MSKINLKNPQVRHPMDDVACQAPTILLGFGLFGQAIFFSFTMLISAFLGVFLTNLIPIVNLASTTEWVIRQVISQSTKEAIWGWVEMTGEITPQIVWHKGLTNYHLIESIAKFEV